MNRQRIKKTIKKINALRTWQLLLLLLLASIVSATALRLNNVEMIKRRNAVVAADEAGDEQAAQRELMVLRKYVSEHMNSNTGKISLAKIYKRDDEKAAAEHRAKLEQGENNDIYKKATALCENKYRGTYGYWDAFNKCVAEELAKTPGVNISANYQSPAPQLYEYDFASPFWTPDLAGWTTLISVFIAIMIILKIIFIQILKFILKKYQPKI